MERLTEFSAAICDELKNTVEQIDEDQARAFFELIIEKRSKAIFLLGVGRCQYMLRAFCMRLMHLGFETYMVGDTTTPAIDQGDLLIVADGAGYVISLTWLRDKLSIPRLLASFSILRVDTPCTKASCTTWISAASLRLRSVTKNGM